MNTPSTAGTDKQVYYRLIALWVLCEAMLGGIIHGFKIPVSGLVVGSCAVICICLIAWYVPAKGAIIKATIIVAIFKMMLSPQAPAPAYIAVFFQGLLGELLFWNKRFFRLSCMLLAVLALLESGLQRILVLTLLYGNALWKVINDFLNGLTKEKSSTNYTLIIGSGYVLLHFITGLLVGWWASLLPQRIEKWSKEEGNKIMINEDDHILVPGIAKRRKWIRKGLFVVWILLIVLYVQSYFNLGTPWLPSHISLKILLRSFIIVLTWYFLISPILTEQLHGWLEKRQTQSKREIEKVVQLLPATQNLVAQSWRLSANKKRWARIAAFSKMILVNALNPVMDQPVYLLTGPIQTGKTTSLVSWSEKRDDVYGILTPVVNGQRVFMNAHLRQLFLMEAKEDEAEVLTVGRFTFSKNNFDKAIAIIREGMGNTGWLVIDEIGPMELRGEGFSAVLKNVLTTANEKQKILLVVREGLTEKVKAYFDINNSIQIIDGSYLNSI